MSTTIRVDPGHLMLLSQSQPPRYAASLGHELENKEAHIRWLLETLGVRAEEQAALIRRNKRLEEEVVDIQRRLRTVRVTRRIHQALLHACSATAGAIAASVIWVLVRS